MSVIELNRVPESFHIYISQVKETDLLQALADQRKAFTGFLQAIPPPKRDYRYAEGKWTIKEILQHIIDAERIFAYRALCIARKEMQSLPAFDENSYAENSKAEKRSWDDLVTEFNLVRQSNEIMFGSFDEEQLQTTGISNGKPIYVKALGFTIVGHVNHHTRVITERYL